MLNKRLLKTWIRSNHLVVLSEESEEKQILLDKFVLLFLLMTWLMIVKVMENFIMAN